MLPAGMNEDSVIEDMQAYATFGWQMIEHGWDMQRREGIQYQPQPPAR